MRGGRISRERRITEDVEMTYQDVRQDFTEAAFLEETQMALSSVVPLAMPGDPVRPRTQMPAI